MLFLGSRGGALYRSPQFFKDLTVPTLIIHSDDDQIVPTLAA